MIFKIIAAILLISQTAYANSFNEGDIYSLYQSYIKDGDLSNTEVTNLIYAAQNPYFRPKSHAGEKFLEALAWYNDTTLGDRNGKFTLRELELTFDQQTKKYLTLLIQGHPATERMSAWKMLQKLAILKQEILSTPYDYYPYRAKQLFQINYNDEWNRNNTIYSRSDFQQRVLNASWQRPVLVKFGLTYCVHCLLMENLASVPAVAKKYEGQMDVYKLWWNPNEPSQFAELNRIASEQGITSSPMFNLYIDGKLVKSGYAFPDEEGHGLEDFLENFL